MALLAATGASAQTFQRQVSLDYDFEFRALAVDPVLNQVYALNAQTGSLYISDAAHPGPSNPGPPDAILDTGGASAGMAVNPRTGKVYVANKDLRQVFVIDGATRAIIATVDLQGAVPYNLVVNEATNRIYVATSTSVVAIDGANPGGGIAAFGTGSATLEVMALNPVTNKLFLASQTLLTEYDLITQTPVNAQVVSGIANVFALALNPVTNRIYFASKETTTTSSITGYDGDSLALVNAKVTFTSTSVPSVHLAVDPVLNQIYFGAFRTLQVFNGATFAPTAVTLGTVTCSALAVNGTTRQVYVGGTNSNSRVMDGVSKTLKTLGTVITNVGFFAVNPVSNQLFVGTGALNDGSGTITFLSVLDGRNASVRVPAVNVGALPAAVAVNPVTNRIFVANKNNNSVSLVDGANLAAGSQFVNVGASPAALAVDPVQNRIYVANSGDGTVSILDGGSQAVVATPAVGANPVALVVNPLTHRIYVANAGGNSVSVLDGVTQTVVATAAVGLQPVAVAHDPGAGLVFVVNQGSSTVSVLSEANPGVVVATLPVGAGACALAVDPGTHRVFVANQTAGTVSVLDGNSLAVIATLTNFFASSFHPVGIAVDPGTHRVLVVNPSLYCIYDGVTLANTTNGSITNASAPIVNAATGEFFIGRSTGATITRASATTPVFTASFAVGNGPVGLAFNPATNTLYAANSLDGTLSVVDTTGAGNLAVPMAITATGVVDAQADTSNANVFASQNHAASFTANVTSAYSSGISPAATSLYYRVDGLPTDPWSRVAPSTTDGATAAFAFTLPDVTSGLHTLYLYSAFDAQGQLTQGNAVASQSPLTSKVQAVTWAVQPVATTVAVAADVNPQTPGGAVTLTATVAQTGPAAPTGTLTLFDGNTLLGSAPVSAGAATFPVANLTAGDHAFKVAYSGDTQYGYATGTLTEQVHTNQITVLSGSGQSGAAGSPFAQPLVVQVTPTGGGAPVANVTVTFTGTNLTFAPASASTDSNGQVSVTVTPTAGGPLSGTASAVNVASATFTGTGTAGAPASLTLVSGSGQAATAGTPFASPLVVKVMDAYGLLVPNATVTFAGAGLSFASASALTDANGLASSTATPVAGGTLTGTASVTGVATAATFTETGNAGAVANVIVVSGSGQSAPAGTAFTSPLVVKVVDSFGIPVANNPVTFAGAGLSFTSANAVTDLNGQASTTAMPVAGGTLTATASVTGVATAASFTETGTAGAPASLTLVSGSGQSSSAGSAFAQALTVKVTDAYNNPVPNTAVTFAGSGVTFASGNTATTDSNGLASVTATPRASGILSVSASVSGLGATATFVETASAGASASLTVVSGSGQTSAAGTAFAQPLVVQVVDGFGNPVADVAVTFSGTGLAFSPSTVATTDSNGLASITAMPTAAGSLTATATAGTLTATFTESGTPGVAAAVAMVSGSSQSAPVGTAFAQPLVVLVTDSYGNPVPNAAVSFTGSGLTFTAGATTGSDGTASVTATPQAMGSLTASASVDGIDTPASFSLTGTPDAPANLTVVSGANQSAPVGTAYANPLVVLVTDSRGLALPNVPVDFTGAGLTFSAPTAYTDASGHASVTATPVAMGALTASARVSGITAAATFPELGTPDAPASIVVVSGGNQTANVGTAFAQPLVVLVTDSRGLALPHVTVTFAGTGLSFSAATASTDSNGRASVTATPTAAGTLTATASTGALSATFTETGTSLTSAAPDKIKIVSGAHQKAMVGQTFAQPLVVRVTDRFGLPVRNVTVTFGGAGLAFQPGTTVTTSVLGLASVQAGPTVLGKLKATATVNGVSKILTFNEKGIKHPEKPSKDSDDDEDHDCD